MSDSDEKHDVAPVSVSARISEFWRDLPRHWFHQADALLSPQKWSDENKYQFVIGKLDKHAIQQVTDILENPPATGKYEAVKKRLLEVYEESETKKVQKLINGLELGDQKPSQLLRRMKELARDKVKDDTLTVMWQNHLPMWVRGVLAVSETQNLDKLALMADRVMENSRPADGVNAVSSSSSSEGIIAEISKLGERLKNMERWHQRKSQRGGNFHRHRSQSRSRTPTTHKEKKTNPNWLCFYHYRYKSKAHKCVQPCSWKNGSSSEN